MSSNRKRTALRKAHDEITYLKMKLALVESHNQALLKLAEHWATLNDAKADHIKELRDILVELEWYGFISREEASYCPICEAREEYGHAEECRLGKALADIQPTNSED